MKQEYIKRYRTTFKLSERQLEQMSALHCVSWFMDISSNRLKDLEKINPEWLEQQRFKDIDCWYLEKLKEFGSYDTGRFKVRKAKKGFVLEMKFNWRSKGIQKNQYLCRRCGKAELLNFDLICKRCTTYLKKKNKFSRYFETHKAILKNDRQ